MTIQFILKRRESLTGKSEAYKKSVRSYLESQGYSQTTDSFTEGSLEDMIFHNPIIAPGEQFVIEAKAEILAFKSKKFAKELVNYFKKWQGCTAGNRFQFMLFAQELKEPEKWELLFKENRDIEDIRAWCDWYNEKVRENYKDPEIKEVDLNDMAEFMAKSKIIVANKVELDIAIAQKEITSASSLPRLAKTLFELVDKRRSPNMEKSDLILNLLPVDIPSYCFIAKVNAESKAEIYDGLSDELIPPFIWMYNQKIITFSLFDDSNPLSEYISDSVITIDTRELKLDNPQLCSNLVNIHLRRILWNRGLWRDRRTFYYPIIDKSQKDRTVMRSINKPKVVTRAYMHNSDTLYAKKGEINFYFHHAVEIETPTYWGNSYIELIPRRYYTQDGSTPIEGEIRAKIDMKFRNPNLDRSANRISLMRFWKYALFDSSKYEISPEKWFSDFKVGDYITIGVSWSPKVVERNQTRLWDFGG